MMKDFEKELIQKMDELSDNVNCFDDIVRKAFHDENLQTEDGYYSESRFENITGKRKFKTAPVLAAVFVLIFGSLFVFQKNVKEFFCNIKQNNNEYYNTFEDIKAELEYELENYTYTFYDLSFEEYQMNIGCINPLAEYPIAEEKEPTNIRVYTKIFTVDTKRIETNQIYLVHYINEYSDENIISITDSKAKLQKDELYKITAEPLINITWENFIYSGDYNIDNSFEINYHYIYKDGENIYNLITSGLFWFDVNEGDSKHYSLVSVYKDNDELKILNPSQELWNPTVYQYEENNGFDEINSFFQKENLISDISEYQPDLFINKKKTLNNGLNNGFPVEYEGQKNSNLRTIEVKLHYPESNTTKYIEYQNPLVFNKIKNSDSVQDTDYRTMYFDFKTIQDLYNENPIEISPETVSENYELQIQLNEINTHITETNSLYQTILKQLQEQSNPELESQSETLKAELDKYNAEYFEIISKFCTECIENKYLIDVINIEFAFDSPFIIAYCNINDEIYSEAIFYIELKNAYELEIKNISIDIK